MKYIYLYFGGQQQGSKSDTYDPSRSMHLAYREQGKKPAKKAKKSHAKKIEEEKSESDGEESDDDMLKNT